MPTNANVDGWKVPHLLTESTGLQCVCACVCVCVCGEGGGGIRSKKLPPYIYGGKRLPSWKILNSEGCGSCASGG